jgi:NAD-dependent dihydropyrimidine dehydrogenase PreA subunit
VSIEFDVPQFDKIDRQENAKDRGERRPLVRIDYDICEDTGVCAQVCPEDVLEFADGHSHVVKPEACTECWICVENCISGAIEIG